MPNINTDEIRDLVAKGWTPPGEALEPFRHLLRPFYDAKGWKSLPTKKLDESDCKNIVGLIATFDHFGFPTPPAEVVVPPEAPWVTVLRAYVADHEHFTTDEVLDAIGQGVPPVEVSAMLERWGLTREHYRSVGSYDTVTRWAKRRAA